MGKKILKEKRLDHNQLKNLGVKVKALGEMFLSKEASPFPPFDERDTQIGVGLMLTEWGDEIMGVAEEIEKFEINSAREIKD